jgi:hypothetical protein
MSGSRVIDRGPARAWSGAFAAVQQLQLTNRANGGVSPSMAHHHHLCSPLCFNSRRRISIAAPYGRHDLGAGHAQVGGTVDTLVGGAWGRAIGLR